MGTGPKPLSSHPMLRFDRFRFAAFGLVSVFNVLALLLHGLNISTAGGRGLFSGSSVTVPVILVLAVLCLLPAGVAALRRGRDLGWPAIQTLAFCIVATSLGPAALLLALYMTAARSKPAAEKFGEAPGPVGLATVVFAVANAVWPWMALLVIGRVG